MRSIVRSHENDDENSSQEQPEPLFNGASIKDNNSLLEAAGFDSTRLADADADAAYALQLQQEEYSKESMIPNRHQFFPFQVEQDDEPADSNPSLLFESDTPQFSTDEQLAAYLQEQENRNRRRYRRPPIPPFVPIRQQSNPVSSQTAETDEHENELVPPFRFAQRQNLLNEDDDDDDDDNNARMNAHAFLQFLANHGRSAPEGLAPFFSGFRRNYRRTGNLQDTEEDFGPEDYEVIQINLFYLSNYCFISLAITST